MKVIIVTVPAKAPPDVKALVYPIDGKPGAGYDKPVRCPINGILAKTLKKDEEVKVFYVLVGGNNKCDQNRDNFQAELDNINAQIGAKISYDRIETSFKPSKQTINRLLLDITAKIPKNAEIFADITFGYKPEILSLFCSLKFVEQFCDADIQYIVYGNVEFPKRDVFTNPMIFDITSHYLLFGLIGSMESADAETASGILKDFLAL